MYKEKKLNDEEKEEQGDGEKRACSQKVNEEEKIKYERGGSFGGYCRLVKAWRNTGAGAPFYFWTIKLD